MSRDPLPTARQTAWKTLNECDVLSHDTAEVLNRHLARSDRPAQATDLVFGVIRHRITLDRILTRCARIDTKRVKPTQWNLLRLGAYELVFAPQTADYAIINEAVEIANRTRSKKTGGFINAVLRKVQRAIESRQAPLQGAAKSRAIPQNAETGCLFKDDLLPDPAQDVVSYLNTAYSVPQRLVHEWVAAYGRRQTEDLCLASNRAPSVMAWPNTLCVTAEELAARLHDETVACEQVADCVRIHSAGRMNRYRAYLEGLFYVQDTTAASAVKLLDPQPDWTVLDLCAAPGGKSMALAMLTGDAGVILSTDANSKRLSRIRENIKRLRLQSVEVVPYNHIDKVVSKEKKLDAILLDVPCSNTGVLARRVEARWRWNPEMVTKLQQMQQDLLKQAAAMARPGTRILYSTCSIQPDENTRQVQAFLAANKQYKLLDEKLTLPALQTKDAPDHDGGYAAVLEKK